MKVFFILVLSCVSISLIMHMFYVFKSEEKNGCFKRVKRIQSPLILKSNKNHMSITQALKNKYFFKKTEYIKNSYTSKEKNNPVKRWGKEMNRHFPKDRQMANRYMKMYSTSLIIRKTQIKTTMRYHFICVRMASIKKACDSKCWEDVEKREPLCTVSGSLNCYCNSHHGKPHCSPKTEKQNYHAIQQFHSECLSKGDKITLSKRQLQTDVHCSFIVFSLFLLVGG